MNKTILWGVGIGALVFIWIIGIAFHVTEIGNALSALLSAIVVGFFYFLPTIIAEDKNNKASIFVVNLFFGWTLIGWVLCLAWAFQKPRREA